MVEEEEVEVVFSPWDLKTSEGRIALRKENMRFAVRQELVAKMEEMLFERRKDFFWFFTFVKSSVAQDYQAVIAVESNTNLIMKRLMFDYYRSEEALREDIRRIEANAYEFNDDNFIRTLAQ